MKPTVAHFIQDYLYPTTNWIYGQIQSNHDFTPIVLARKTLNEDSFPVDRIYATSRLPTWQRALDDIYYRSCGYSRFFANRSQDVSLIHAHFGHIGFKALALARHLNVPLVTSFYGYDVSALGRVPRYQKRFIKLFEHGQTFLAEGPHLARSLVALGCPSEKVQVFHLGVTPPPLPKVLLREARSSAHDDRPNRPVRILFAATFTEKKGWRDALTAFSIATKKLARESRDRSTDSLSMRLRLIGGGEDDALMTAAIRELGIESLIERSGFVTHDELLQEMLNSDIFLQPSRTAANGNTEGGAPVTLIDAQSVKLAICSTTHADIPEVAPHEVSALLSPEGDVERLSENLLRLACDHDLRRKLGDQGRAHIEAEYNWNIQGPRLAAIYRSALE